ncbi:MAG TPA: putative glycoside hydrolase [Armatimonadota bacterium]|nr:putative glycoside hydrolase [Armatimonadota bacterium]
MAKRDNICCGEGSPVTPEKIKALNPDAKVYCLYDLLCKNIWDSDWKDPSNTERMQTPLTRRMIDRNNWWLRGVEGTIAKENDSTWLLDVGKPGFKEAYLDGALSRMDGKSFDGVVFDYLWPSASSLKQVLKLEGLQDYPSDDEWFYRAWKPFFEHVVTGLQKAGYRVIGNCAGEYGTIGLKTIWQRSKVDGTIYEQGAVDWRGNNGAWLPGNIIERRIKALASDPLEVWFANNGIIADNPAVPDTPDFKRKVVVSLAMYYIGIPASQEKRSYDYAYDWKPFWDPLWDLYIGEPVERAIKTPGKYFWSRKFTCGVVLLNYESQETINFSLDGEYRNPAGERVTGEISITPHTALILANEEQ